MAGRGHALRVTHSAKQARVQVGGSTATAPPHASPLVSCRARHPTTYWRSGRTRWARRRCWPARGRTGEGGAARACERAGAGSQGQRKNGRKGGGAAGWEWGVGGGGSRLLWATWLSERRAQASAQVPAGASQGFRARTRTCTHVSTAAHARAHAPPAVQYGTVRHTDGPCLIVAAPDDAHLPGARFAYTQHAHAAHTHTHTALYGRQPCTAGSRTAHVPPRCSVPQLPQLTSQGFCVRTSLSASSSSVKGTSVM